MSYHVKLKERQQAADKQRVESINRFAQTLVKRGAKKTAEWVQARIRVAESLRARDALNAHYHRFAGSQQK